MDRCDIISFERSLVSIFSRIFYFVVQQQFVLFQNFIVGHFFQNNNSFQSLYSFKFLKTRIFFYSKFFCQKGRYYLTRNSILLSGQKGVNEFRAFLVSNLCAEDFRSPGMPILLFLDMMAVNHLVADSSPARGANSIGEILSLACNQSQSQLDIFNQFLSHLSHVGRSMFRFN